MRKMVSVLVLLCLIALCLTGCQQKHVLDAGSNALTDYLSTVEAQSSAIKISLEKDPLTQNEMNQKSSQLRELWEAAMDHMLEAAKKALPAAEMEKLAAEQDTWLETRKSAMEAAGKEVEGGSMHGLIVNMEAAKLTEERVYALYAMLK